ncbi:hypothetical protein P9H28_01460 [Paenibacillus barengoltzii]|uniref:hypothetical protein n=1 Tax=Paenibacillus barengoltzii TaxID=343517 RepID=UPI000A08D723|nr:hypothetical protein [Paenibacillus barengoltzii]MEC2342772.1 hypothetical protein [Paenibacillus barengoltzii]SMF30432.1 hypothetical protein SAMN02744102_02523 [Paenibacillus barengoltzii]
MENQTGQHQKQDDELGYLFNVEILVKGTTNPVALQALMKLLNDSPDIIDYRINSGIELGRIIESTLASRKQSRINTAQAEKAKNSGKETTKPSAAVEKKKSEPASSNFKELTTSDEFQDWIQSYITGNKLVRLYINRNGKRTSMPCRILNFLPETYAVSVYHVDEKQVYTLKLSEIIDFLDT